MSGRHVWKPDLRRAWRCRYVECMPDVGRVQLLPEDSMVIMASDGLWDVLSDQQAVETAEVRPLRHVRNHQDVSDPNGNFGCSSQAGKRHPDE